MHTLLRTSLNLVVFHILLVGNCLAAIFASETQLGDYYDFVVVGGGTAGLVVANRLTEDDYKVLVLEAGGDHRQDVNISVPFFCQYAAPFTMYDWNYTTVPQKSLGSRTLPYPLGFLLGGGSSINYLVYTRGTKDDYNQYATLSGDQGWSWDAVQKYFMKIEKFTPPADGSSTDDRVDPSIHGDKGMLPNGLPEFPLSLDNSIVKASKELPEEFPYNPEPNGPSHIGIGWSLSSIGDGSRSSSVTAYLADKYSSRPNLDVLVGATVTRVLQSSEKGSMPTFATVEYMLNGQKRTIKASKEIILSAGAVHTPTILMHSGIGDASELSALGIKPIVNLPSVGKNLTDHLIVGNSWTVNSTDTFEQYTRNSTKFAETLLEWKDTRSGVFINTIGNQLGFLKMADIDPAEDPSAGPTSGNFELIVANGVVIAPPPPEGNYLTITIAITSPSSRGTITINSSNPLDMPLIDPNFLATDIDRRIVREAIKSARRFVKAPAFDGYVIASTSNATTDDEIDEYAREMGTTVFHPVSTAKMSPKGAQYGVVDPDLKVKGVKGLRVIDASVLPRIPSTHPQVTVYVFAERGSDLVKQDWS